MDEEEMLDGTDSFAFALPDDPSEEDDAEVFGDEDEAELEGEEYI